VICCCDEEDFVGQRAIWPVLRPVVQVSASSEPPECSLVGNPKAWGAIEACSITEINGISAFPTAPKNRCHLTD
jgi:hypothetical protein